MPKTDKQDKQAAETIQPQTAPTAPIAAVSVSESQTPAPPPTPERLEAMAEADRENIKRDFLGKVVVARAKQEPQPYVVPPVPERIVAQTNAEMAAGAAMVAKCTAEAAQRPQLPKEKWDGDTTSIFRPADYVPDPKKNTGQVAARTISAQ